MAGPDARAAHVLAGRTDVARVRRPRETADRGWWSRLAQLVRPAVPRAGVVAALHAAELVALPLAVAVASSRFRWLLPLAAGLVSNLARAPIALRLRTQLRPAIFLAATRGALARGPDVPEARAQDAFRAAAFLEQAVASGLPAAVGAALALALGAALAWHGMDRAVVVSLGAVGLGAAAARTALRRTRSGLFDDERSRRGEVAGWFAAAARATGEIRTDEAQRALRERLGESAQQWAVAEGRLDAALRGQWLLVWLAAAAAAGAVLVFVAGLDPRVLVGAARAPVADPNWRGVAVLVAAVPAAVALLRAFDQIEFARRSLHDVALPPAEAPTRGAGVALRVDEGTRLEARDVTVRYGAGVALDGVSLALPLRGLTVVVGPNGSGKTTLARLVAGVLSPTAGALTLAGHRPDALAADAIAYVPQSPVFIDALTVEHNVRLVAPEAAREDIASSLQALGFALALDRGVDGLSRGERQRIAVARALVTRAALLVLDEPDTGLDLHGRRALVAALRRASAERAVLVVTHRADLARHADRVVVLSEQHALEAVGSVDEATTRSATFRALLAGLEPAEPPAR